MMLARRLLGASGASGRRPLGSAPARRLIVDTDGGIDDVQALVMALRHPEVEVEAVTTCFGNMPLEQATRNAGLVLSALGSRAGLFAGASTPLAAHRDPVFADYAHGADGLGGGLAEVRRAAEEGAAVAEQEQGAVAKILDAAERWPGQVELVLLGPMTNLALALEAGLPRDALKRVVSVGGSLWGRGNVSPCAEFNVFADPEAARRVLSQCEHVELVTWDLILDSAVSWDWLRGEYLGEQHASAAARIVRAVTPHMAELMRPRGPFRNEGYPFGDPLGMAVALEPRAVVKSSVRRGVGVECEGALTTGVTVIEHRDVGAVPEGPARESMIERHNVEIVTEVHAEAYRRALLDSLS